MKHYKKSIALLLCIVLLVTVTDKWTISAADDSDVVIYDLTIDGEETVMGEGNTQPVFAWKMKSGKIGAKQTAYQLIVTKVDNNQVV